MGLLKSHVLHNVLIHFHGCIMQVLIYSINTHSLSPSPYIWLHAFILNSIIIFCRLIQRMKECLEVWVPMEVFLFNLCFLFNLLKKSFVTIWNSNSYCQPFIELLDRNYEMHAILSLKSDLEFDAPLEKQELLRIIFFLDFVFFLWWILFFYPWTYLSLY
jgi:hypothetical protein